MISRTWHGIVPGAQRHRFAAHLAQTGVKEARALKGNRGVYVQVVEQDAFSHFFLCTLWDSWEDVVLYAGSRPGIAITYPGDEQYGLISDPIVIHQEVTTSGNPFAA